MEASFQSSRTTNHMLDPSPLLNYSIADHLLLRRRPPQLQGATFSLIRRASSRGMMLREPSFRVRENAAEELEERHSNWAYSTPVVALDVIWNLAFVAVSAAVMWMSKAEEPQVPLRVWIYGYGVQCLFHVGCVVCEYRRRRRMEIGGQGGSFPRLVNGDSGSDGGSGFESVRSLGDGDSSVAKHLESVNTMFSFVWWLVGFYWVTFGGKDLEQDSHHLYWLCITFLAFDVVFVIICVAIACLVGIVVCCCLPCVIGILYAMTERPLIPICSYVVILVVIFCRFVYGNKQNGLVNSSSV